MKRAGREQAPGCRSELALLAMASLGLFGLLAVVVVLLLAGWPHTPGLLVALMGAILGLVLVISLVVRDGWTVAHLRPWPWTATITWNAVGIRDQPRYASPNSIPGTPKITWDQAFSVVLWRYASRRSSLTASEMCLICQLQQGNQQLAFHTWVQDDHSIPPALRSAIHSWPRWHALTEDSKGILLRPAEFTAALTTILEQQGKWLAGRK